MTPARLPRRHSDGRLAWMLVAPAFGVIVLVALVPIAWTIWESLHRHDLRMPWLGRPFVGLANYAEAVTDARAQEAFAHTVFFTAVSVTIELGAGLALALGVDSLARGRGAARTAMLLPWAVPTVVGALVWRFMFETPAGLVTTVLDRAGLAAPPTWFADPVAAWVPLILADAWKTTPFVAILVLAGLQAIDRSLYEAARMDGAGAWRQFRHVTLPLLRPALLVAFLFRVLDAFRVFDVMYVLTGGGPGTATEPLALLTFTALMQHLRFGYGAALSVIIFGITFGFALLSVRLFGSDVFVERGR